MQIVTRLVRKLMKHGNSRVLALPPEMREALGIQPSDSMAIYQLRGALLVIPLNTLNSGQSQRTLEALLMNQD
jgi:antitoxin component of MazEF toxin-antitoxin module